MTPGPGRAPVLAAQATLGRQRLPGTLCWLSLGWAGQACGGPRPSLLLPPFWSPCPSPGSFLPLLRTGVAICHLLPPPPPNSSHSPAIDQVTLAARAAPAAAARQPVPPFPQTGGCRSCRLLPGGPPRRPVCAACMQGWRALALPGRSDPLGHLLFSLETKISWACPKLFQVCLLFKKNIQIPRGKSAPLRLLSGSYSARPEQRGREIAGAFGRPSRSVSWVPAPRVSRWGLGRQPRPLCPLPLASLPAWATFRASSGVAVPGTPGRKEAKPVGGGAGRSPRACPTASRPARPCRVKHPSRRPHPGPPSPRGQRSLASQVLTAPLNCARAFGCFCPPTVSEPCCPLPDVVLSRRPVLSYGPQCGALCKGETADWGRIPALSSQRQISEHLRASGSSSVEWGKQ